MGLGTKKKKTRNECEERTQARLVTPFWIFATMLSCHALWDGNLFWWAMHQTASSTGAKIIVCHIPLQWSLFRNNSHSFSCEAVRLLWTSSAPVSITETPTKIFPPKILLFIESVVWTVWKELPMTVVGSQEGLTERIYPHPALRVQRYTKLIYPNFTQCESKFYVQISW